MRKTRLYWFPQQITLLQQQQLRLKALCAVYPQLLISPCIPPKFTPKQDYIRLTSSQAEPTDHLDLLSTIVYCLKLSPSKKQQLEAKYQQHFVKKKSSYRPTVYVTNNFGDLVRCVIRELGYQEVVRPLGYKIGQDGDGEEKQCNRFQVQKQRKEELKNMGELVPKQQFMKPSNIRQAARALKLNIDDIQKIQIAQLIKTLQKQLTQYLAQKHQLPPSTLTKQFQKIRQSKSLTDLCRACLHFYTLQQYSLYANLNFLLRNIRSVVFREQLEKVKLFAFLLMLNYLYVYEGDYGLDCGGSGIPGVLYRWTDCLVEPELLGQVVTAPSFYSVSAVDGSEGFSKKQTKIIIRPLVEGNRSISLSSIFPIHYFSAFKKEQQYLYIPFTCFLVTQVRYKKSEQQWVVQLREVPGNPIIKQIFDINLFKSATGSSSSLVKQGKLGNIMMLSECFSADWELKCQQKYQGNTEPMVKIKTLYNFGLIFLRLIGKYEMAANYFSQGINRVSKLPKSRNQSLLLLKGYNYLGLAYLKSEKLSKSQQSFALAEKYIKQLSGTSKNPQSIDWLIYLHCGVKNNKALLLQSKGQYTQAIKRYKEALEELSKCGIPNQLMEACIVSNMGACLAKSIPKQQQEKEKKMKEGQYEQIWRCLKDAFVKYLQIYGMTTVLNQLVNNQLLTNNEKQLMFLYKAVSPQNTPISELIPLLEKCSETHEHLQQPAFAIQTLQLSISLYLSLNLLPEAESQTLMYMKSRLAKLLMSQGDYEKGIQIYEQLLPNARLADPTGVGTAIFKGNIAAGYVNMGTDQGLKKALWWYEEAIRDISAPLLSENLEFYNKLCDLRKEVSDFLVVCHPKQKQ